MKVETIVNIILAVLFVAFVALCILWRFYAPCWLYRGHTVLEIPARCLTFDIHHPNGVLK